jgi:hypothetical protein
MPSSPNRVSTTGRLLFGAAMIFLGIELIVTGHLPTALVPVSQGVVAPWIARGIGVMLGAAALAVVLKPLSAAPYLLAVFPILAVLTVNGPKLMASPRSPNPWTSGFELMALAAAAVLLVRPRIGRIMLAAALAVFGIQHLMYGEFVATLVPDWIPAHIFWAYGVGFAFLAAALSTLVNRVTRLSGFLLGIMFFSWVLLLHWPGIAGNLGNEREWTSGLLALGLSGAGLILSGVTPPAASA